MHLSLLDFVFPRRSLTGIEGTWITPEERIRLTSFPVCIEGQQLRRLGLTAIDRIVTGTTYRDCPVLHEAIHRFKYGHTLALAPELRRILTYACDLFLRGKNPVLCPVPLHWTRLCARGFNQAALLADDLAHRWRVEQLLRRVRPTGSQARRGREERRRALTDAFRCIVPSPPPFVLLVDDVSTTGTTFDECAKALKIAGVQRVEGVAVAHG